VRPDRPAPTLLELGPAATIDPLTRAWREALPGPSAQEAGAALRAAVWDPIAPHVAGCQRLILAPDGALLQVPLDALPVSSGEPACLLDRFEVRFVLSGRDLFRHLDATPTSPPVVLGEPAAPPSAPASTPGAKWLARLWGRLRRALGKPAQADEQK